ncbi:hypothetical protein JAAARDRAFT_187403 [Jaapia argillacea MUCL 33604]|uniref:Uncharacterized protein n=1 Tax=Jaapia argillacea MUCL 33604 TaxID=933084 RepID=A0A067QKJ3_9AGAM|nr:hypothetical protein JAAARDRAFT_187403 [Jaapia argillacea MUCL 33604]
MPAREINTIINFICHLVLLLMEGIHLLIILSTYTHGALIHIYGRLLQLVISTTRTTYQPIAVHEIHFHIDLEGNVAYHLGDLYNKEGVLCPWQTAPTPPPPTVPLPGIANLPASPPRLHTPVTIENNSLPPIPPIATQCTPSPTSSTGWDPLDHLCEHLEQLCDLNNPSYPTTCGNTPDYKNFETTDDMTTLLELINKLALSADPPKNTSPRTADMSSPPFTFDPNPSDMLDIPLPPSPNPFQPPGPNYSWGNE